MSLRRRGAVLASDEASNQMLHVVPLIFNKNRETQYTPEASEVFCENMATAGEK